MSSILEALRKSEQNRQQQIQNNSDQLRFGEQHQPPRSRKGFYFLCLLLLLVAAALWLYQQGAFTAQTPQLTAAVDAAASSQAQVQPPAEQRIVPPNTDLIKQQVQQAAKQTSQTKPQTPPKAKQQTVNQQSPDKLVAKSEKPPQIEPIKTPPQNQPNSAENTKPDNGQNQQQAVSRKQKHLRIHQLPYVVRKDLPPVKLNIHIYDPKVESRMVILNGERYAVGDKIEEIGSVKDITQEGVVLEINGVTFMIPKL